MLQLKTFDCQNSTIHLGMCVDDNYCPYLGALIASIIQSNKNTDIICHILHNGLNQNNLSKLMDLQNERIKIKSYQIDSEEISRLKLSLRYKQRISLLTYYRFLLPSIISKDIKKIIYLDVDMLVVSELSALWKIPIEGSILGAVEDGSLSAQKRWQILKYSTQSYFNAGMLVIDAIKWKKENILNKIFEFESLNLTWEYNDQDILNILLHDKVHLMDLEWNTQTYHVNNRCDFRKAKIIHFTGVEKPWHISSNHPFTPLFDKMSNLAGFNHIKQLYLDQKDEILLDKIIKNASQKSRLAIASAGQRGRRIFHAIQKKRPDLIVVCFIDGNIKGNYKGISIVNNCLSISFDLVVIASVAYKDEIAQNLISQGVEKRSILKLEKELSSCVE